MSNANDLAILAGQLSEEYKRGNFESWHSLLYNDLRELVVSGNDEISPRVIPAFELIEKISTDKVFVESYLGAFCYFYRFSVRRIVGIFSPPVEFGFKYDYRQDHFNQFCRLLRGKLAHCGLRQQLYYSAIISTPVESTKKAFVVIDDPKSTRPQRKNAALLVCNSIWRNHGIISSIPQSFLNGIRSKKTEAVTKLFMMKLDFKSANALLKDVADEDAEVDWCQSFFSVIVAIGLLFSFPDPRTVDLVFEEIGRLRSLLQGKERALEFEAYKCLNEDAALVIENLPRLHKSLEKRKLANYFLLQARELQMQSHELLRQGFLVTKGEKVEGRDRILIYDYATEIVRV